MDVTIYHNPRCSKSRQALGLLEDRGIVPRVVRYLETPPSVEELDQILRPLVVVHKGDGETSKGGDRPRAALGRPPEAVVEIL